MTSYDPDPRRPMFKNLVYCTRCGMPATEEEADYDELGICVTCRSSEQKMHMDWVAREATLKAILDQYRGNGDYDCLVPISGGKDSSFQLHLIRNVYGMKPLAVTFSHNWFSEVGSRNLRWCLETFDVDHIMFTPSRGLVNRCARRSLEMIGDACWHCHSGVGAFPLHVAVKYDIPLICHGESAAELCSRASYDDLPTLDRDYFVRISGKAHADEFACEYLPVRDLAPFRLPGQAALDHVGVLAIHLGNYVFWDGERQTEILRDRYGWQEDQVEGTYKRYKSVECRMPGLHDFTKFLKRGYGRATDHAAQDVRAGLMTRSEANELVREHDPQVPKMLGEYLRITGYTEAEFYAIMGRHRDKLGVLTAEDIAAALDDYRRRFPPADPHHATGDPIPDPDGHPAYPVTPPYDYGAAAALDGYRTTPTAHLSAAQRLGALVAEAERCAAPSGSNCAVGADVARHQGN